VLNGGRFDLGFYAGRIYGLCASSFVLIVLLVQNGLLYTRLVHAYEGERRARTRMQEKSRELTAANQELDAFSYTVSHDLRAPLRHVQGYIELLERDAAGEISDKASRYLDIISNSAETMDRLIDDLLAFSKTGRGDLRETSVDMRVLIDTCIAELEPQTSGRAIDWAIAPLPLVRGDPGLLRQVWANLLGNAVKYSRGRARARIEVGTLGEEGARCVFFVRDNGAGFDMAHAGRLFGVFQRLHAAGEFEGTGVGLATVQRIVVRHGGRAWAESVPGQGSTFYFTAGMPSGLRVA
jgi:light-regulated signal transduction histidine kinase (bacteriophytochrome)